MSVQGSYISLRGKYPSFFYNVWYIEGCGCVRPRVSYGPKEGITCKVFINFWCIDGRGCVSLSGRCIPKGGIYCNKNNWCIDKSVCASPRGGYISFKTPISKVNKNKLMAKSGPLFLEISEEDQSYENYRGALGFIPTDRVKYMFKATTELESKFICLSLQINLKYHSLQLNQPRLNG